MSLPITPLEPAGAHAHQWTRVPDTFLDVLDCGFVVGFEAHNAACDCGATEWVHWRPADPVLEQEC